MSGGPAGGGMSGGGTGLISGGGLSTGSGGRGMSGRDGCSIMRSSIVRRSRTLLGLQQGCRPKGGSLHMGAVLSVLIVLEMAADNPGLMWHGAAIHPGCIQELTTALA